MKTLFTIVIILFLKIELYSQWTVQNKLNYQTDITSVQFTDQNNGFAVGDYGVFFTTTDGGINWSLDSYQYYRDKLNSIFIVGNISGQGFLGYTVGDKGTILKIVNGKPQQDKQISNTAYTLNSVYFTSADIGYCVGNVGTILKTTNGGTNWVKLNSGTTYSISSIFFADQSTGYAVGGTNTNYTGIILKTTDAGNTWKVQYSGQANRFLYSVYFKNTTTGWACGWNGTVLKTTNGGTNWVVTKSNVTAHLRSIRFADLLKGMAVGSGGTVIKTTDGGLNWIQVKSNTGLQLNSLALINANTAVAVGNQGTVTKTTNTGSSWIRYYLKVGSTLSSVIFTSANKGWIIAGGPQTRVVAGQGWSYYFSTLTYVTTDGGNTWLWKNYGSSVSFKKLFFYDDILGWAITDTVVYKTTNGGISWNKILTLKGLFSGEGLTSIYFLDKNAGWIAGTFTGGLILRKTTDGGTTWNIVSNDIIQIADIAVYFINKQNGWLVGYGHDDPFTQARMFRTTDFGNHWSYTTYSPLYFDEVQTLTDITFTSGLNGYAVGGYKFIGAFTDIDPHQFDIGAMIVRTTDGGQTWIRKDYALPWEGESQPFSGLDTKLNAITFTSPSVGYAVGTGILKTTNAGDTWFLQNSELNIRELKSVDFTDVNHGWAVGTDGVILKYLVMPKIQNQDNNQTSVVKEFNLYQNYPNPFNPSTRIKFDLPENSKVNISIYNLLGERIAELVNGEMESGYHEVEFDANNLPSGIYFYRIDTDKFHQSQKMILLK